MGVFLNKPTIEIGRYTFEGPYKTTDFIKDLSGVYSILTKLPNGNYKILDIGESKNVKTRLDCHDRKTCWKVNIKDRLYCAVYYTPNKQQTGRKVVEQELRKIYDPVCGDR